MCIVRPLLIGVLFLAILFSLSNVKAESGTTESKYDMNCEDVYYKFSQFIMKRCANKEIVCYTVKNESVFCQKKEK